MAVTEQQEKSEEFALSTGHTISLPARTEATMSAVILPADRDAVADLLPSELSPIRAGWKTASVWLMSVEYHDIDDGTMEPYNEFVVAFDVTPGDPSGIPYVSPLLGNGGYVWSMPVTHEPARAFGDEIWGYPKVVADIDIEESDGQMETTVTVDGDHFITLSVERPWTFSQEDELKGYTLKEDELHRVKLELSGQMGLWPYSKRFSVTLGDHPQARQLATLDLGDRAFARSYLDGEIVTFPPKPLDSPE